MNILIIDDDENIRSMLEDVFRQFGHNVWIAEHGKKGLGLFKRHSDEIDLVILDMKMPVMGGKKTFEEIRKIKSAQRILMISGTVDDPDLQDILQHEVVSLLKKPFTIQAIISKVNLSSFTAK